MRGFFNLTGFYNKFADKQLALALTDHPAVVDQVPVANGVITVGKSRIYGVEVEAGVTPFDGLTCRPATATSTPRSSALRYRTCRRTSLT